MSDWAVLDRLYFISRTPLGDGAWILKEADPDSWFVPSKAARYLHIAPRNVYRLIGQFLAGRKRGSRNYISLRSIARYNRATAHPDFWKSKQLQDELRLAVAKELREVEQNSIS